MAASPVDFASLVPASVLPIWSVVSVLALEVNNREEEEKRVKGGCGLNRTSSIFAVFTYNKHTPDGAYIVCEVQ